MRGRGGGGFYDCSFWLPRYAPLSEEANGFLETLNFIILLCVQSQPVFKGLCCEPASPSFVSLRVSQSFVEKGVFMLSGIRTRVLAMWMAKKKIKSAVFSALPVAGRYYSWSFRSWCNYKSQNTPFVWYFYAALHLITMWCGSWHS